MYTAQEAADAYAEATDSTRYLAPKTNCKSAEFDDFWKNAFDIIEDMPEVNL